MTGCSDGCNGCDECTDYDDYNCDYDDEPECERCHGDGRDPWFDYLMPCPACQGEQRALPHRSHGGLTK